MLLQACKGQTKQALLVSEKCQNTNRFYTTRLTSKDELWKSKIASYHFPVAFVHKAASGGELFEEHSKQIEVVQTLKGSCNTRTLDFPWVLMTGSYKGDGLHFMLKLLIPEASFLSQTELLIC